MIRNSAYAFSGSRPRQTGERVHADSVVNGASASASAATMGPTRGSGNDCSELIRKREIAHVKDVEGIVLPALDLGADQILRDVEIERDHRHFLEQDGLGLLQQLGALV